MTITPFNLLYLVRFWMKLSIFERSNINSELPENTVRKIWKKKRSAVFKSGNYHLTPAAVYWASNICMCISGPKYTQISHCVGRFWISHPLLHHSPTSVKQKWKTDENKALHLHIPYMKSSPEPLYDAWSGWCASKPNINLYKR